VYANACVTILGSADGNLVMVRRLLIREGLVLAAAGAGLTFADRLPGPLGYYVALMVLTIGPGRGIPPLLFGADLSLAETALLTVLGSIAIVVVVVSALLAIGIGLDQSVMRWSTLGLTVLGSAMVIAAERMHSASVPAARVAETIAFFVGLAVVLAVGALVVAVLKP